MRLAITGGDVLIDDEDLALVQSFGQWYKSDTGYAMKKTRVDGKNVSVRMHRVVIKAPHRLFVDHINGNRLDNRKANLRIVAHRMNTWNKTVPTAHRTYADLPAGVTYDITRKKYLATKTLRKRFNTLDEAVEWTKNKKGFEL